MTNFINLVFLLGPVCTFNHNGFDTGGMASGCHMSFCLSVANACMVRPEFLNFGTFDIFGQIISCWDCLLHCKMGSSVLGLTHWMPPVPSI